jgi:hypothetical protein
MMGALVAETKRENKRKMMKKCEKDMIPGLLSIPPKELVLYYRILIRTTNIW